MNGAFISPEVYKEIFSPKKRAHSGSTSMARLQQDFSRSPYCKVVIPFSWIKYLSSLFLTPEQIVVVARPWEAQGLSELSSDISKIVLVDKIKDLKEVLCSSPSAQEVVYWAHSSLAKENLKSLPWDPRLRWLFSYDVSHKELEKSLHNIEKSGLPLQTSEFLELSPETDNIQDWYAPQIRHIHRSSEEPTVQFSIIIPFQDNYDEVRLTLPTLIESLASEPHVEIIVANDSYDLKPETEVLSLLKSQANPYVYFRVERHCPRTKGDTQFRAGVVRNLAAAQALGAELVFLDSDILVSSNIWKKIRSARQNHAGPLMPRRHFLRSDLQMNPMHCSQLQIGFHTQLSWGGHWEDFYRTPTASDSWKWTSTYCLSVPKELFIKSGGFGRAFSSYGFEDTDLGYRLQKMGHALQVLDEDVFHLPYPASRSEYASHFEKRKQLLNKSFGAFYRSALHPELLSQFRHILS